MPLGTFWAGATYGLAVALPLGPINLEIIRRGLGRHPLAGAALGAGAVTADLTYMTLAYFGVGAALLAFPGLATWLQAGGGVLLILLGAMAWRDTMRTVQEPAVCADAAAPPIDTSARPGGMELLRISGIGLLMTGFNPMTISAWVAISSDIQARGGSYAGLALGVACGAGSWVTCLTLVLAFSRRWIGRRTFAVLGRVGAVCLVGFGAAMLARAFTAS